MGVGPFTVTYDRLAVVDYSSPTTFDSFGIVMRRPESNAAASAFLIFKPYKQEVWLTYVAAIILGGIVLFTIGRMDFKKYNSSFTAALKGDRKYDIALYRHCVRYTYGSAFNQGILLIIIIIYLLFFTIHIYPLPIFLSP